MNQNETFTAVISFAMPLVVLGFVCSLVGGMMKAMAGSSSPPRLTHGSEQREEPEDKYIVERAREISRKTSEPFEETLRTLRAPIEAPHYRVLGWIVREDPDCLRGEFGLATGITVNPDLPEKEKKVVIAHEIGHGESICTKLKAGEEVTFGREFECLAWQEGIPAAEELDILDEYLKEYQKEAKYLACEHYK